jgi:hypothetical protein
MSFAFHGFGRDDKAWVCCSHFMRKTPQLHDSSQCKPEDIQEASELAISWAAYTVLDVYLILDCI